MVDGILLAPRRRSPIRRPVKPEATAGQGCFFFFRSPHMLCVPERAKDAGTRIGYVFQHVYPINATRRRNRRERAARRCVQNSDNSQRREAVPPPPQPPASAQELTAGFGKVGGFRPRLLDAAELPVPVRPSVDREVPVRVVDWRKVQARIEGEEVTQT